MNLQQRNEAVTQEIVNLVNPMGNDDDLAKVLGAALAGTHRTLQQNFWRMIWLTAYEYAKNVEGHTDLRNEASLEFAKMIRDEAPSLPFV